MKIYVASSWRNSYQPEVVSVLREQGHEVYDFRNPAPGDNGFHWSELDEKWQDWSPENFRDALNDPIAVDGFNSDASALKSSDCCVLVLPSGRSAHLEAGFMAGMGKPLIIFIPEPCEPELMYSFARKIVTDMHQLIFSVKDLE